jgi:uncharacterized membrane protein
MRAGDSRRAAVRTALMAAFVVVVILAILGPSFTNARVRRMRTCS